MPRIFWKYFAVCAAVVLAVSVGTTVHAAAPSVVTVVVPTPANGAVTLTWTNPAEVDFTGTMVRYSTSTFPTTTAEGVLASDVAGAPSGTSSTTVSGLTNGTTYYFSLFSHNAVPEYGTAVNTQQVVMAAAFSEDFEALSIASIGGQNGWATLGGSWSVVDNAGEQTLKSTADGTGYSTNRVLNGGSVATYSNQMVRVDWKGSTASTPGQVFLRAQSSSADAGGYFMWQSAGTLRLNYKTTSGAAQTQLTSVAFTPLANTWYTYEFSVVNNSAGYPVLTGYVWQRGTAKPSTPSIQFTDTMPRFAQGVFSVGKTGTSLTEYDNVVFYGMPGDSLASATPGDGSMTLAWTNPTYATYAGTMVRVSTSAFPATPNDGTLVASVAGSSGATSTTTQTGLTNGTTYYYTLFPYDNANVYGTPLYLRQIAYPVLVTDNFSARSIATLAGQDGWTSPGGTWSVTSLSGNNVVVGTSTATYPTNKVVNGIYESTNQVVVTRFRSTASTNTTGYVWLRLRPNAKEGYLVWHNGNAWTVSYRDAALFTTIGSAALATAAPPMEADTWFNLETSIVDNGSNLPVITVYVWKEGAERPATPTLQVTDTVNRSTNGYFAIGKGLTAESGYYDDVAFYGVAPGVAITSPAALVDAAPDVATLTILDATEPFFIPYIQTSSSLTVTASVGTTIAAGGGVEFVLNEGLSSEQSVTDLSSPYSATFTGLAKAEYTVDAYVLESDGVTHASGATNHDTRTDVAIGDIITAIGDSITEGTTSTIDGGSVASWIDADAGTVSTDNRQFPQYGPTSSTYKESFLTDMNNKLAALYGYPVFIMNEGVSGARANTYVASQMTADWIARQTALHPNKWLINLGVNDAAGGITAATYESDMTALINHLINNYGASGSQIYLAYQTYRADIAATQATYIAKVDAIRTAMGLAGGPDYFTTFENYLATEYFDGTHPNEAGFVRMGRLAALSMMQPTVTALSYGGAIRLSWTNIGTAEPTVAGYRINYGTNSSSLASTVLPGNVTTYRADTTLLSRATNYYFTVTAFDNDPYDVSYSDTSAVTSAIAITSSASSPVAASPGRNSAPDFPTTPSTPGDGSDTDVTDDTATDNGTTDTPSAGVVVVGGDVRTSPFTGEVEVVSVVDANSYIRGASQSTVYFVDADGVRHPFMDAQTFATYDVAAEDIVVVTDATLPEMLLGVPMLPKEGTVLVKIMSDPRVYALEADPLHARRPLLRWIPDESTARAYYGSDWADSVIDVNVALFARFGVGEDIPMTVVTQEEIPVLKKRAALVATVL